MIILVLSTPRSGSHYYTECIAENYPDCVILHELLSRANKQVYLKQAGEIEYSIQYHDGCYYHDIEDGTLVRKEERRPDLELFFDSLINKMKSSTKTYILHEHVSLLPNHWIDRLIDCADSVTYLKRNRREQIASRVIAGYTSVYIVKPNYMLCHGNQKNKHLHTCEKFTESIIDQQTLQTIIEVYEAADSRMSSVHSVAYESLPKRESNNKKLFVSSYDRLCEKDQRMIDSLLSSKHETASTVSII
jgi:hypothetical protein